MPKNIVILCDGTSNEISKDRTNILRLYGTLKKDDMQIVYYDPGVGTFGADDAASYTYRRLHEFWGLMTGWGLDHNVKEAYRFIVRYYDNGKRKYENDQEADKIYLFGFSRGAYTARVLAGFIHNVGLLDPVNLNLLDYAYRAYKDVTDYKDENEAEMRDGGAFAEVRLYERMLRPQRPQIKCLGLFDTVSSVLESGRRFLRFRSHASTRYNPSVEHVRHAVAIDERRTMFQPQLWPLGQNYRPIRHHKDSERPQDAKEVWFSGSHGDVGGGYPEAKSALAKIPLHWMVEETAAMGLRYKTRTVNRLVLGKNGDYVAPDPLAVPNNSMKGIWPPFEYLPRRKSKHFDSHASTFLGFYLPRRERRVIPADAQIHGSVHARRGTPSDFPQPNLP